MSVSVYLSEASLVIWLRLASSHASLIIVRAGLQPPLFQITCMSVSVYLSGASLVIWLRLVSSHAALVIVGAGLWPALFLITWVSCVCVSV